MKIGLKGKLEAKLGCFPLPMWRLLYHYPEYFEPHSSYILTQECSPQFIYVLPDSSCHHHIFIPFIDVFIINLQPTYSWAASYFRSYQTLLVIKLILL